MKKRLLASVLALALVLSLLAMPAGKAEAKSQAHGKGLIWDDEAIMALPFKERAERKGYIPYEAKEQEFPTSFDLREYGLVTSVKDQNPYGTCWTFAAIGSIETNALMMGYGEYDLSEYQLGYFANNLCAIEGDMLEGEGMITKKWYDIGGNATIASATFSKGFGPVLEETAPYKNVKKSLDPEYARNYNVFGFNAAYAVSAKDFNGIKELITRHGGVDIGFWAMDDYYNAKTSSWYVPADVPSDKLTGGHAVLVVGWDDNYSKDNFKKTPEGDGAWLVKNSWSEEWGDDGYFWLSYYDTSIVNERGDWVAFTVSPKEAYDFQYQYDGGIPYYYDNGVDGVAIKLNVTEDQTLTGVRISPRANEETGEFAPVNATINVYRDVTNMEEVIPEKSIYTQKAAITTPGYQVIEFNKGVNVNAGEKIYVTVTFDQMIYYTLDGQIEDAGIYSDAKEDETYVTWGDGVWTDYATADDELALNVCIKVLARTGHDQKVIHRDPNAVVLDEPTFYLLNNEEAKVTVTWKAVEGAEGYNIYRKIKGQEDDFSLLATVDANASKYYDTGLTLGTDYIYKVVPFVGSVEGNSAEKTIRATIAAPWITKLENNKKGQVKITIQNVKGAKSYSAYRLIGKTYQYLGNTTKTTYVDTFKKGKYEKGVTYTYKLAVKRGDRTSALSAAKTITTTK